MRSRRQERMGPCVSAGEAEWLRCALAKKSRVRECGQWQEMGLLESRIRTGDIDTARVWRAWEWIRVGVVWRCACRRHCGGCAFECGTSEGSEGARRPQSEGVRGRRYFGSRAARRTTLPTADEFTCEDKAKHTSSVHCSMKLRPQT